MRAFKYLEQTLVCILLTFIDVDSRSLSVLFKKIFLGLYFLFNVTSNSIFTSYVTCTLMDSGKNVLVMFGLFSMAS